MQQRDWFRLSHTVQ